MLLVCVRMRSAACSTCCAVLSCLIDWIVVPCFVSVVSRMSRSTLLPRVVSNDITSGDEGGISRGKCRAVFSLLRTEQATMAGAIAGRLEPFDPEAESIVVYLERVELYFAANKIKADKRVLVFLNLIGRENYSLLRSILSPQKPAEQPLKKLMDVLREYYEPKKVVMAARFLFHQRQQQPGESVAIYLAELRKLAVPCEFRETLDEALRDRLVCGLRDEAYQKRLLSEPELTLDKALQIAQSMETADVNARALRGSESGIHQMSKGGARSVPPCKSQKGHQAPAPGQQGRECYRCGSTDHIASHCRFASFVCRKCQKKGHLARVCHSSKSAGRQGTGKVNAKTHQLTSARENTEDEVPLLQLGQGQAAPITVDVTVNDVPVTMEVDTGAAVSVMSRQQQQKLFLQAQLHPSQVLVRTYTAEKVAVLGILPVRVAYEGQEHDLTLVILQGNGPELFGREWLAKIRLSWPSIAFHTVVGKRLDEVLQQFQEVFREELGTARTPSMHLKLKQNSQPKFVPARSVPFAIKDAVAQEIQRLESVGILKKVEFI